jgi:hypothetical protein
VHDWWSPIIGVVIGFLAAWGVLQLTEHRRRKRAQAVTRRAIVAELRHTELILSSTIVNLSIGTDAVADAVRELKILLEIGTERMLRTGVLDLTMDQLEALRHLQGISDQSAAEILRTLWPTQRARPLKVESPVLDVLVVNPIHGFGDVELQALSAIRWQMHLVADEARLADEWLPLASTMADTNSQGRALATFDGTRESYRRRAIVAVRMIRDALGLLKATLEQRNQTAVVTRRARARRIAPRSEVRSSQPARFEPASIAAICAHVTPRKRAGETGVAEHLK